MSTYTTQAEINGEIQMADLIGLTDDENTGQLNATILSQIIANASGEIDQACANLYGEQLPFNPVPSSVASMALTIVCYRLYRRRAVPDEQNRFFAAYSRVRDFLDGVNKAEFHLNDVPARDFAQVAFTGRSTIYGVGGSNQPATSM
jgi:phage gp36-like protein